MNKLEEVTNDATQVAVRETLMQMTKLPPDQRIPYMVAIIQVSFELLRNGGKEDEFVRGLLDGARAELNNPCFLTLKDLRVN